MKLASRDRVLRHRVLAILAGLLVAAGLVEVSLRLAGFTPWRRLTAAANEPTLRKSDPELGWVNRPGVYDYAGYARRSPRVHVEILPDGGRATGRDVRSSDASLALVGCSFTFGHAISDEETLAWKLQAILPDVLVENHAVGGYGTLQSLLMLERLFSGPRPPRYVIYGFLPAAHPWRNVGHPGWQRLLAAYGKSDMIAVPYAELSPAGRLVLHPPAIYPHWPFRQRSALVNVSQQIVSIVGARNRVADAKTVTEQLLERMAKLTNRNHARLLIVALYGSPPATEKYAEFARRHAISLAHCAPPERPLSARQRVPGETHPNGTVNSYWANCIATALPSAFGLTPHPARSGRGAPSAGPRNFSSRVSG